ncbi:MAG: hypothetical protein ACE5GX_20670, partial [Thermoanaerobaculia bacterium]
MKRKATCRATFLVLGLLTALPSAHGQVAAAAGRLRPVTVSPGSPTTAAPIADRSPTFLWGAVDDALLYELVVFRVPEESAVDTDQAPVLRLELPGSALGFTPSLDQGLQPGAAYAWMLRAETAEGSTEWSEPAFFRVADVPTALEVEQALEVLRGYVGTMAVRGIGDQPDGGSEPDAVPTSAKGAEVTELDPPTPALVSTPDIAGIVADPADTTGVVFGVQGISNSTGDGSSGIAGQSIAVSGNVFGIQGQAASAEGAGGVFDNTAGGDILRGFASATEVFTVEGSGNVAATSFSGDGANLTNVPAATATQLAADGTDCAAGEAALGVDQLGNSQGCHDVATQAELDSVVLVNDGAFVNVSGDTMTGHLDLGGNTLQQGGDLLLHTTGTENTGV